MSDTSTGILVAVVLAVVVLALVIVAELDRQPHPQRFGISLKRTHLHGETDAAWRWRVVPLFTSQPITDLVDVDRTTKLAGRTRTYLGAWFAGARARRRIENLLITDRERFLEWLQTRAGQELPAWQRRYAEQIFPAETSDEELG